MLCSDTAVEGSTSLSPHHPNMETMNDILKEIFESFADAQRIGQRISAAAEDAIKKENEEDRAADEEEAERAEKQPWNADLNPQ